MGDTFPSQDIETLHHYYIATLDPLGLARSSNHSSGLGEREKFCFQDLNPEPLNPIELIVFRVLVLGFEVSVRKPGTLNLADRLNTIIGTIEFS